MDSKELNRRKNEDYEKFLDITNRKAAIFLDTIIESEYDPLEPNRRAVKVQPGYLKDPTMVSLQKAAAELAMLGTDNTSSGSGGRHRGGGVKAAPPKEMLPVEQWAQGKIDATPYGSFAKLMSDSTSGSSARKKENPTSKSHITFDHYTYPRGKAALDPEMPRGKRIHPEMQFADPARAHALPPEAAREIAEMGPPENAAWCRFP